MSWAEVIKMNSNIKMPINTHLVNRYNSVTNVNNNSIILLKPYGNVLSDATKRGTLYSDIITFNKSGTITLSANYVFNTSVYVYYYAYINSTVCASYENNLISSFTISPINISVNNGDKIRITLNFGSHMSYILSTSAGTVIRYGLGVSEYGILQDYTPQEQ